MQRVLLLNFRCIQADINFKFTFAATVGNSGWKKLDVPRLLKLKKRKKNIIQFCLTKRYENCQNTEKYFTELFSLNMISEKYWFCSKVFQSLRLNLCEFPLVVGVPTMFGFVPTSTDVFSQRIWSFRSPRIPTKLWWL